MPAAIAAAAAAPSPSPGATTGPAVFQSSPMVLSSTPSVGGRAVALHGRALAPVLAVAALVELGEPRRAVRVGRALAFASFRLDTIIGEVIIVPIKRVRAFVVHRRIVRGRLSARRARPLYGTSVPPYCCTQSLDWVEGRCVLVAA